MVLTVIVDGDPLWEPAEIELAEQVAPVAAPGSEHVNVTLLVNGPPSAVVTAMLVPTLWPGLAEDGELMLPGMKFWATVTATVVVAVTPVETPVIVTVAVVGAAAGPAVSVSVLVVEVEPGLNCAVTPLGRPDAERLTAPENPLWPVTVTVLVPDGLPPAPPVPWGTSGAVNAEADNVYG